MQGLRVLVVHPGRGLPAATASALRARGWDVCEATDFHAAAEVVGAGNVDAVLVSDPGGGGDREAVEDLYRTLDAGRVASVVVADDPGAHRVRDDSLLDFAPRGAGEADLALRLATVSRHQRYVRQIESELEHMQRLGKRLNEHFSEVDQEMRLASRLQRDFLPKIAEPINNVTFRTIYRPASWVSGDIYDVFRVDEDHVACYVADAVGHGMAASLLTIFIKQAVVPKRITGERYDVLDPAETLAILNEALVAQTLPNAQFVTACYALLNTRTRKLRFARGGHPYPLLFSAGGGWTELKSSGGLLGLFGGETFPSAEVQLEPGDKVVLYTDGFELVFQEPSRAAKLDTRAYLKRFEELCRLPLSEMIPRIEALLDADHGSLNPRDDVSVVAFEIRG
ncbi:MAG: hypothetical protein FLDDKLPJ_01333 [Phycisphaerae bacterium]|nr:hypothetical protein [Phycisphaerae bacterium]